MNKKGVEQDFMENILLWILFLIVALIGVGVLIKKLTS